MERHDCDVNKASSCVSLIQPHWVREWDLSSLVVAGLFNEALDAVGLDIAVGGHVDVMDRLDRIVFIILWDVEFRRVQAHQEQEAKHANRDPNEGHAEDVVPARVVLALSITLCVCRQEYRGDKGEEWAKLTHKDIERRSGSIHGQWHKLLNDSARGDKGYPAADTCNQTTDIEQPDVHELRQNGANKEDASGDKQSPASAIIHQFASAESTDACPDIVDAVERLI